MFRHNFFKFYHKAPQFFNKKDMGKTKKAEPDLKEWTLRPGGPPPPHGGQDTKNKSGYTLPELRPQPQKGANKQYFFSSSKIPDLVQRPTAATVADENCR